MGICGKWEVVSGEDHSDLFTAVEVSAENQAKLKVLEQPGASSEEISVAGSTVTIKVLVGGNVTKNSSLTVGSETDDKSVDGRDVKSTVTADDNKIVRTDKGAKYTVVYTREASGDTMTQTISAQGISRKRTFKRV